MKIGIYDTRIAEDLKTVLVKEKEICYGSGKFEIHCPEQMVSMMNDAFQLDQLAEEHCYMIAANARGFVLGIFFISKGTVCSSLVGVRELFIRALLCGAVSILLCHNHPSKDTAPSSMDVVLTKKVKESGELLGIPLLDHVIIGGSNYYSFKEHDMM